MSSSYGNNVGLLRLFLASCVIIGHAPELVEGNRLHEPMTMLFHTVSLGEMAVYGFFLLSGYLVTASLLRAPGYLAYLAHRFTRIYPAFWLASLLIACGLAPALGMHFGIDSFTPIRLAVLAQPPAAPLPYLPYPELDGAMWTLAYEMRCYLLIALLHALGVFRNRWICLGLAVALVIGTSAQTFGIFIITADYAIDKLWLWLAFGLPHWGVRLTACFLLGASSYLFRAELNRWVNGWTALAALVLAVLGLPHVHIAETSFIVFGGLVLYWLVFKANLGPLQRINDRWDISYGTYLYGWPVSLCLLIWVNHRMNPALLALASLPLAYALGAASWYALEKPAITLGHKLFSTRPRASMVAENSNAGD